MLKRLKHHTQNNPDMPRGDLQANPAKRPPTMSGFALINNRFRSFKVPQKFRNSHSTSLEIELENSIKSIGINDILCYSYI